MNERDASQSGGIQSTMRNVGQAIGVALLGAILLFGITNTVRTEAAASPHISDAVAAEVAHVTVDLGSDQEFKQQIADIPMTADEQQALVQIDARARYDSTRTAYAVGAVIVLLGLATTPAITVDARAKERGSH